MNRIDARRFAAEGRELTGTTTLSGWSRAAGSVVDPSATIRWTVAGGTDDLGRPVLSIGLEGAVDVVCQRCLQPLRLDIGAVEDRSGAGRKTNVLLASNERELDAWDEEDEEAEVVLASQPLDLDELLEDEFLLSLPFSPMCDDPACPRRAAAEAAEHGGGDDASPARAENPFAALRDSLGPKNH